MKFSFCASTVVPLAVLTAAFDVSSVFAVQVSAILAIPPRSFTVVGTKPAAVLLHVSAKLKAPVDVNVWLLEAAVLMFGVVRPTGFPVGMLATLQVVHCPPFAFVIRFSLASKK